MTNPGDTTSHPRWGLITVISASVVATGAVIAALISVFATTSDTSLATSTVTVTATETASELSASGINETATVAVTAPTEASDPALPGEEVVIRRQESGVALPTLFYIDFDSEGPGWGIANNGYGAQQDVRYNQGDLRTAEDTNRFDAQIAMVDDPSFDACARAGYSQYVSSTDLFEGATFCFLTNEGRYAGLEIEGGADGSELILTIIVWESTLES